jgi:hypothetical protein
MEVEIMVVPIEGIFTSTHVEMKAIDHLKSYGEMVCEVMSIEHT